MVKFEWNALRLGDKVLVHGPGRTAPALTPGVVAMIDSHREVNGVGIRMDAGEKRVVLWPGHMAVHHDPLDASEPCWRCQAIAETS